MQKKKQTKLIKQIIAFIAIIILVLLIAFAEDIIKLNNKNKTNLAENSENELISNEPNPPQLSAGMIPVKWNGTNWIITTANDKDWYDYSKGKPAYIMLNDGYYQSELIRDMSGKELAENAVGNDALVVPNVPNNNPTILIWIPRFAEGDNEEIGYLKEEIIPSEYWIVPRIFSYIVDDETKPNYYLSGIWVGKDADEGYESKISQMNSEESIYGFIKNTVARKPFQFGYVRRYIDKLSKLVVDNNYPQINDITNANRIILQIVNTNKVEPIKANIKQNAENSKIEIQVTYTANGIREILDDNGTPMTLIQENGIIYTDTGDIALAKGTYYFTIVDNKEIKQKLSITPTVHSLLKVAYINGIDNMDNTNTYTKTQETTSAAENALGDQLIAKYPSIYYWRAITDINKAITAIGAETRTEDDEQLYLWNRYKANSEIKYVWKEEPATSSKYNKPVGNYDGYYYYRKMEKSSSGDKVTISSNTRTTSGSPGVSGGYTFSNTFSKSNPGSSLSTSSSYYYWSGASGNGTTYTSYGTKYTRTTTNNYSRGDHISTLIARDDAYTIGSSTSVHSDNYWYTRGFIAPKYTLYKYDQNLNVLSTYDVDTKTITTASINISNKGTNKVKLKLNTTGTDYKTYISNDNTDWREVTDIASNTPKELNVDEWDSLYIKIETNTSRINNIDVSYYKN